MNQGEVALTGDSAIVNEVGPSSTLAAASAAISPMPQPMPRRSYSHIIKFRLMGTLAL